MKFKTTYYFLHFLFILFATIILLTGCSDDEESLDTEYPVIDETFAANYPQQCSEIKKGESFTFIAHFTDNQELGSYSIDIHHNFDHHNHSTEVNDCNMDPIKTPENPFLFINNFSIPEGQREYTAEMSIDVPADVDNGDYHFLIMLTDHEGWQTIKGISFKIID
ncbi:DUF4625 domain-containing protein [Fulvivirga maritima]|uniref:DUF4625 domain-containing protein n=1 Tax=Fulvivirga maritima TaxID=2904247 RepID=UPI001F1AE598|nr:DUF4625 domain-containing protein [Fulvivirga maritima]UII26835.1 DUF4625 domain-containing protein [Fulvivirga maritima]